MTDNVTALPGCRVPGNATPQPALVSMLRDLLAKAEAGDLQSFIGTGFMADGCRIAGWADLHTNLYEMAGSLTWLHAEYIHRHTSDAG